MTKGTIEGRVIIYIDPHNSGMCAEKMKNSETAEECLARYGCDEDNCSGEIVYYYIIDGNYFYSGELDFT